MVPQALPGWLALSLLSTEQTIAPESNTCSPLKKKEKEKTILKTDQNKKVEIHDQVSKEWYDYYFDSVLHVPQCFS